MPIGIFTNAIAIALGGFLGGMFGKKLPDRVKVNLPFVFGIASMAMGVSLIMKMHALPSVLLSLIIGTFIGELIDLEHKIETLTAKSKLFVEKITGDTRPSDVLFIQKYVGLIVLFCTGATGILGVMTESITGDHTILFAKSVLDIFTSAIFATSLGYLVSAICVPQFILFIVLYFLSGYILPLTNPAMIGDFTACGGITVLAVGFRLCEMKHIRVMNMLPALFLTMPISWLWTFIVK